MSNCMCLLRFLIEKYHYEINSFSNYIYGIDLSRNQEPAKDFQVEIIDE